MKWDHLGMAMAAVLCSAYGAGAQDAAAPAESAPPPPNFEGADFEAMSVEDLLAAALIALEHAETRGPDVQTAVTEASRITNIVLSREPNNLRARYYQARLLVVAGRVYDALKTLQEWANSDAGKSDWKVFKILGAIYQETYPNLAVPHYLEASKLNPKDPTLYVGLSIAYGKQGKHTDAVSAATQAVNVDPNNDPIFREQLVKALLAAGKPTEAEDEAVSMVERSAVVAASAPADATMLIRLDQHLTMLIDIIGGNLQAEIGDAQSYIRLAQYTLNRAGVAQQMGFHDALAKIEAGVTALSPNPPAILLIERARLFITLGRRNEAIHELKNILSTDPANSSATELLNQLQGDTKGFEPLK